MCCLLTLRPNIICTFVLLWFLLLTLDWYWSQFELEGIFFYLFDLFSVSDWWTWDLWSAPVETQSTLLWDQLFIKSFVQSPHSQRAFCSSLIFTFFLAINPLFNLLKPKCFKITDKEAEFFVQKYSLMKIVAVKCGNKLELAAINEDQPDRVIAQISRL